MDNANIQKYYLTQLTEQVSFLIDACNSYDKGNFAQAKMMSAIIRTIVKDPENPRRNNKTKSLLTLLNKKNMLFLNTGFEVKNPKINVNLVGIATIPSKLPLLTKQFDNIYLPLLNDSEKIDVKLLSFEDWWNSQIIYVESENSTSIFTRKRIVLTMAEQDGGSHVDSHEDIDPEYLELATAAKSFFINIDRFGNESPIINMHFALVRQIAHELIVSLIKEFNIHLEYQPTNEFNLNGLPKEVIKQPVMMVEGTKFESSRTKKPFKLPKSQSFTTPEDATFVRIDF
ncbi:hypothetical protein [Bacillus weihaiensis]|uniref:hypothetical protein n=1 Tax=Bacillus weihaiensis TaxID=1547283 RepID=UPI002357E09A|nr:hypothetical protein [Bacillus weihaiensis]